MNRSWIASLFVALVAALVVAGCGRNDTGGAIGSGTTAVTVPADVALAIEVAANGAGQDRQASLTCQGDKAYGTGFLLGDAAQAACQLVRLDQKAQQRLLSGPSPDRLCTQVYGGPQVATITGTLMGQPVNAQIDRKDGCGIADWNRLQPLVGPAE